MNTYAFRLKPGTDLKLQLAAFAKKHRLLAGCILSCVGSLEHYHLRFANKKKGTGKTGYFEILSLTGTLSSTSMHVHLTVADSKGRVRGGHLLDKNIIYTTAEIVIGELSGLKFDRHPDSTYGYRELVVKSRKPGKG